MNEHAATLWNDTQAVSPVMGTLVLILVSICGAGGVAVLLGTFSSDVSAEANTRHIKSDASIELVIAGCTTIQPISEEIAEAYMNTHPGIRITVQGGGSHAGIVAAGIDAVDVGAASRGLTDDEHDDYPDVRTHLVGGSAVVVITGTWFAGKDVSYAELRKMYDDHNDTTITICSEIPNPGTLIVQRSDDCGTEDMMNAYLGCDMDNSVSNGARTVPVYETGNEGVLERVKNTPNSVGFVDYGFAVRDGLAEVEILGIVDGSVTSPAVNTGASADVLRGCVTDELNEQKGRHYPAGLARPMNYVTSGSPDILEDNFITFAQSPATAECFQECGMFWRGGD